MARPLWRTAFQLAAVMGRLDIDQMLLEITGEELRRWQVFFTLEENHGQPQFQKMVQKKSVTRSGPISPEDVALLLGCPLGDVV